jgi:hypothetical protein
MPRTNISRLPGKQNGAWERRGAEYLVARLLKLAYACGICRAWQLQGLGELDELKTVIKAWGRI